MGKIHLTWKTIQNAYLGLLLINLWDFQEVSNCDDRQMASPNGLASETACGSGKMCYPHGPEIEHDVLLVSL